MGRAIGFWDNIHGDWDIIHNPQLLSMVRASDSGLNSNQSSDFLSRGSLSKESRVPGPGLNQRQMETSPANPIFLQIDARVGCNQV